MVDAEITPPAGDSEADADADAFPAFAGPIMAVAGLLFAVVSLCPLGFFAYRLIRDLNVWLRYRPAPCVVVSTLTVPVTVSKSSRLGRYVPKVVMDCEVTGRTFRVTAVETWGESGASGADSVDRLLDRFQPGTAVTAWHDPGEPPTLFVFTRRVHHLYLLALVPALMLFIGIRMVRSSTKARKTAASDIGLENPYL